MICQNFPAGEQFLQAFTCKKCTCNLQVKSWDLGYLYLLVILQVNTCKKKGLKSGAPIVEYL